MTATISLIPALLELAMALFLLGILVLLWTLDDVVAIAITTVATLFLVVITAFTIFPIFFKTCPYKSPTAWACVVGYDYLVWAPLSYMQRVAKAYRSAATNTSWRAVFALAERPASKAVTWRTRDILAAKTVPEVAGSQGALIREAIKREIVKEAAPIGESGQLNLSHSGHGRRLPGDDVVEALLTDVSEMHLLFKALLWVSMSSQDAQVTTYINQCLGSIHPEPPLGIDALPIQTTACWCIVLAIRRFPRSQQYPPPKTPQPWQTQPRLRLPPSGVTSQCAYSPVPPGYTLKLTATSISSRARRRHRCATPCCSAFWRRS